MFANLRLTLTAITLTLFFNLASGQLISDTICTKQASEKERLECILEYCRENLIHQKEISQKVFDEVLAKIKKQKLYSLMDDYLYSVGYFYYINDYNDSALVYFNKVNTASDNFNFFRDKAVLLNRLGKIAEAKATIEKAMQIASDNNNTLQKADAYRALGVFQKGEGLYSNALRNYQQALVLYQEVNNQKGQASIFNNISSIYTRTENYPLSIEYLTKANRIYKDISYYQGVAGTLTNIGVVHERTGEYEKALKYLFEALDIYNDLGFKRYLGLVNNNIGFIYQKMDKFEAAQNYYFKSLKIRQQIGDKKGEASTLQNIGVLFCKQGAFKKAQNYLEKSLNITTDIEAYDIAPSILEDLSDCFAHAGNYRKAYDYMQELKKMNDRLFNEKRLEQLAEMESRFQSEQTERDNLRLKYENEIKEKTIKLQKQIVFFSISGLIGLLIVILLVIRANKLLKLKNKEIGWKQDRIINQNEMLEKQKIQLQQLNKAKDQYFSIATQNLWEPVGTIRNLLNHMLQNHGKEPGKNIASFIKTSKEASVLAFNLLENLLYWARIQQGQVEYDPGSHMVKPMIDEAVNVQQPRATAKLVVSRVDIPENLTGYYDEELMKIVFRNLIENAIKFSTRGGEITVKGYRDGDKIVVKVADTGVGMTRDQVLHLFKQRDVLSTPGTHGEKGGGLGLIIAKAFIERNFGTISAESHIAEGTTITVHLPANKESLVLRKV